MVRIIAVFKAATGLAVIILGYKNPDVPRSYRAWGYLVLPLFFVHIIFAVFVNAIRAQPFQSLIGVVTLIARTPAFLYWKSKGK